MVRYQLCRVLLSAEIVGITNCPTIPTIPTMLISNENYAPVLRLCHVKSHPGSLGRKVAGAG